MTQSSTKQNQRSLYIAFIAFACGYFLTCIFRSLNAVQAPYLVSSLHIPIGELGVLTSSYLLAFGLAQIPLGILLDHFGIRIIQTLFFIFSGIGVLIFAHGTTTTTLTLGRFIIGLGASGGLMAAYKANTQWFYHKLALMNGITVSLGGLGALAATRPTQLLIAHFGWRQFNIYLAIATFIIAVFMFITIPTDGTHSEPSSYRQQLKQLFVIYKDKYLWRIMPISAIMLGFFMAIQGLWAGGWLIHVNNMSVTNMARCLSTVAISMIIGSFTMGWIGNLARKHNYPITHIIAICATIGITIQIIILLRIDHYHYLSWFLFTFFMRAATLNSAAISHHVALKNVGKAITAMNFAVFLVGFSVQFLIGWIIHFWIVAFNTQAIITAYQVAFGIFIVVEIAALIWLILFTVNVHAT